MTTILNGLEGLKAHVGQHLGFSPWFEVTQERINLFAEASGDRQWIHIDVERAAKGPFGRTIAHGLLTLAMIGTMAQHVFKFEGFKMGLNYGYEKIRFPSTVPVGSKLRLGAKILSCDELPNAVQTVIELTIELEGSGKPACAAQMVLRHVP
jgi:acyl dehydratase